MIGDSWFVAVFRCRSENIDNFLIDFYNFVKGTEGVRDLHFLIRDRTDDEVVFSFRVLTDSKIKQIVISKISYKLKNLMPEDKFAIDPNSENPLSKYSAWSPRERVAMYGAEKFTIFCSFLSQMSKIVVDMAQKRYFSSGERIEMVHNISWMLGCTEYGLLTTTHMEVGYYDRIKDKYCSYLKQSFTTAKKD